VQLGEQLADAGDDVVVFRRKGAGLLDLRQPLFLGDEDDRSQRQDAGDIEQRAGQCFVLAGLGRVLGLAQHLPQPFRGERGLKGLAECDFGEVRRGLLLKTFHASSAHFVRGSR
jgi:hypothetical protein